MQREQGGYTLVELMVALVVLGILVLSSFSLFTALLHSAVVAQRQAVAMTFATNQMEYLKSLPYDSLAVQGGSIVSSSYIPASFTKKANGITYTIATAISYADNAYDGCGSYPTQALKQKYCRDYPPPTGAPSPDTNPADYKDLTVTVKDVSGTILATDDSQVAALVAESASNTGAMFVSVVDGSGNPVVGANVNIVNSSTTPAVNVNDSTDQNGVAIFYDLPPSTTGNKYVITASNAGYSTLSTIAPNGALQPTYPSQNLIAQSSSYVTLTLKPMTTNSLIVETTDLNGGVLAGVKVYMKGGYKKYTSTADTSYYYDNMTPSDVRPTTDSNGLISVSNLVPGSYIFCGDLGATSCTVGNTTYYLAAAVPYGGSNPLQPITVPIYDPTSPPTTTFSYNSSSFMQKVRLMLTTSSSFPRIVSISPGDISASGNLSNFAFNVTGSNIPCNASASSCGTDISLQQGSNNYDANCTGTTGNAQQTLSCTANLTGITTGSLQLIIKVGGNTLSLPVSPQLGGFIVGA